MPIFVKKPIQVEAFQYLGTLLSAKSVCAWVNSITTNPNFPPTGLVEMDNNIYDFTIMTLEGRMIVSPMDWVIKGIKGEYYPCKPDIFIATYSKVRD